MSSKKAVNEVLSFKRLKSKFKPKIIDAPAEEFGIYNALSKLERLLDDAIFPIYSFEPQLDITNITKVTQVKNKNKEARKVEQKENMKTNVLIKQTCFQCFENVNQCFAYLPNLFQKDTDFLKIDNDLIDSLKIMIRPPETVSRVYNMPHFLAYAMHFRKLERKKQVSYGIMMERLTSGPSIPIIDKPWNAYQQSFLHAMMLCKLTNVDVDRQFIVEYMMSWESNTPSVLDYRFFLLSIKKFFHHRMKQYYQSFRNSRRGPIVFYQDFLFQHRPYYCNERSIGFLSSRWILPFDISSVFSASEIGVFSTLNTNNITTEDTIVHKINYDIRDPSLFVIKKSSLYDVTSIREDEKPNIEMLNLSKMNTEVDESVVDEISFIPSLNFDQKTIVFNIKDYEPIEGSINALGISQQVLKDKKSISDRIFYLKKLSKTYRSNHVKQDIFKGRYYSYDLIPQDMSFSRDYDRRLMANEMFHQWSRDLFSIEIMKDYIVKIEEQTRSKTPIAIVHEIFIKPAMLNEFDRIMLNDQYVFSDVIQPAPSSLLRTLANMPITSDDVMIRYFLFLNNIYEICLTTMRVDTIYLQINTDILMVIKHIRKFPPSIIVNWVSIWLIMQNIPYNDGFDVQNSQYIFNKKMLPLLYQNECLPIRRKYYNKTTCFSSLLAKNDDYMWANTRDYVNGKYHNLVDYFNRQIDLAKLSFFKLSYSIVSDRDNQIGVIDPKRYFLYKNRLFMQDDHQLTQTLVNLTNRNIMNYVDSVDRLKELCHLLSPVKKDNIINIQNMIDFYMACINQMNCYMQYMIMRGNEFIKRLAPLYEPKQKAGAVYISSNVDSEGNPISQPRLVQFENILDKPRRTKENIPSWLFEYNPHLQKLEQELIDVKKMLNHYQRPDVDQLGFFTDVILYYYPREDNDRIIDILPLIENIMDALNDMIRNNQNVDIHYATQKTVIMNDALEQIVDIYVLDSAQNTNNLFRRYIKAREHFDPATLNTVKSRQERLERWIFIEKYVSYQYKVVNEFYEIMDTVGLNSVGLDAANVVIRLMHTLYEANNFINRDLPIAMNTNHEVIKRDIALGAIKRNELRDYLNQKKTIIELSNFTYFFKSWTIGIRHTMQSASLPIVLVRWFITIKNINLDENINHDDVYVIRINPDLSNVEMQGMYKVHLPFLPDHIINYVSKHETCYLYANLILSLVKPPMELDYVEEEEDIVVYPPLSMPSSSITVLGKDVINADEDRVYHRINRFNNFMYLRQPDELFFLEANITQEFI